MTKRRFKKRWDYALINVTDEGPWVAETLWEEGKKGWELVAVTRSDGCVQLFFKRPL